MRQPSSFLSFKNRIIKKMFVMQILLKFLNIYMWPKLICYAQLHKGLNLVAKIVRQYKFIKFSDPHWQPPSIHKMQ